MTRRAVIVYGCSLNIDSLFIDKPAAYIHNLIGMILKSFLELISISKNLPGLAVSEISSGDFRVLTNY